MRTLQLTIKSKWFNLILLGKKKEEYREIKPYWTRRLQVPVNTGATIFQSYGYVQFTNGYGKDKPTATFECLGIRIGKGDKELGASSEDVFIIKLGKEISRANILYVCPECKKKNRIEDKDTYYINIEDELFCNEECLDIYSKKRSQEFEKRFFPRK